MKPSDRHVWIRAWIANSEHGSCDVLDAKFVGDYIDATRAAHTTLAFGADRSPQLGRDLTAMYQRGLLTRGRVGLTEHYTGMPNWVYVYRLPVQEEGDEN